MTYEEMKAKIEVVLDYIADEDREWTDLRENPEGHVLWYVLDIRHELLGGPAVEVYIDDLAQDADEKDALTEAWNEYNTRKE
jgi:hypothetical protein